MQSTQAVFASEISQLKATAAALREQMELARLHADSAIQAERQKAQSEVAQLQAAIVAMRDSLDQKPGAP